MDVPNATACIMIPNDDSEGLQWPNGPPDSAYSDKCLQGTFKDGLPLAEVTLENQGQNHTAYCASTCSDFGYTVEIPWLRKYAGPGVYTCPCVDVFAKNATTKSD